MIISEMKIVDIHSLIKAMTCVNEVFGGQIWWRGNPDIKYHLQPSVFRPKEGDSGYEYESNINARFMQKAPALRERIPDEDAWLDWLFLMQHYGLPTRLLDWTESPLVACYFAVNNENENTDGALFALSPYRLNYHQTKSSGLQTSQKTEALEIARRAFIKGNPGQYKVLAILPNLIDARMVAQLSVFTIHNDSEPLEENENSSDFLVKYEIPSTATDLIRKQLKHAGIRPSSIFPDLEHLAKEIKEIRKFKDVSTLEKIDVEKLHRNCLSQETNA
jgi:hypothetical protein